MNNCNGRVVYHLKGSPLSSWKMPFWMCMTIQTRNAIHDNKL